MKNILIATMPEDTHALYVQQALKKIGHTCTLWYTSDFPTQQQHSFHMHKDHVHWHAQGKDLHIDDPHFDAVWFRRPRYPVADNLLHPDDKKNAAKENLAFYDTFWEITAPDAHWINPPAAARAANCKLLQLKKAANSGFNTPETLISNHPDEIRAFIVRDKPNQIIYKSMHPLSWRKNNDFRMLYTHPITVDNLPSDAILQRCAGIYQKKIKKAYELRITCMGNQLVAARIDSTQHRKGKNDWRTIPPFELPVTPFELPSSIKNACHTFMQSMGLVFGCIDMIVTPDNDYYFLEVNEQGQFLWIEKACPEIKILDTFVQFISNDLIHTTTTASRAIHSMTVFDNDIECLFESAIQNHVLPPQ